MAKKIRRRRKKTPKYLQKFKKLDPKTGKLVQKETKPERNIRLILRELGIQFEQESKVSYKNHRKSYDFLCYADNYCFLIEADGNYFHAYDYRVKKKSYSTLTKLQKGNVRNDKLKDKIAEVKGIPLLRFWESDINGRPMSVKTKIKKELERQKGFMGKEVIEESK